MAIIGPKKTKLNKNVFYYNFTESKEYCGATIYVNEPYIAGYLNYCESNRRGGFYYDPWENYVQDSFCENYESWDHTLHLTN